MPLGLGYVASYAMSKTDAQFKVVDYGIEKYSDAIWRQTVSDYSPDVVGFSALTLGYQQVNKMAMIAREFNPLLIAGGAHATIIPEDLLGTCDVAVRGEGEETFYEIISGKKFQDINGIAYNHKGRVWKNDNRKRIDNLDELPMPAYQLFNMKGYKQYGVIGSRGCPYNCLFCASTALWNRIMRLRSPANIVNEIQILKTYGAEQIVFQDDTFNLTIQRGLSICNEIIERKLNISFTTQMRANKECVSPELFTKMKEAGCVEMTFGIESGSDKIMKSLNKNLTVQEASSAVKMAHQVGISTKGFFMVGNWDETPVDIIKTWWFVARNPIDTVLTVCTPLPGTQLYKNSQKYLENEDWSNVNWVTPIARTDKMSKRTILAMYYLTVILVHLPAHIRSGNAKGLLKEIWNYTLNKVGLK